MTGGPLDHVKLHYVDSVAIAQDFMSWLGQSRRVLGVDTETTGFSPDRDRIRLIQFGDKDTGWAIPWEHWGGVGIEALNKYEGDLVLHNSKFDSRFIVKNGGVRWPWHRTHDTMAMAHLIDPRRPKGLKPLAARLVDSRASASSKMLDDAKDKNGWTWATVPVDFPYYWLYGALDPVLTCHIFDHLYPEVEAKYMEPYELEMGTTRVIAGMEARGARTDRTYCKDQSQRLSTYSARAMDWLRAEHGLTSVNSSAQVKRFLQSNDIAYPQVFTKSGADSMGKAVLETVLHRTGNPVVQTILNVRRADKMVGPYFSNFLTMMDDEDRLHCNIWTMGTRTARMSVSDPALQTLPRKDPTVRKAFIPSEDHVLITCDYDQIEARLMAHFSQDQGLADAFAAEEDFFCVIASQIFGRPITKADEERQLTKNTVYGKMYAAGVQTMSETAGVELEVMRGVVKAFDSRFPGVKQFQSAIDDIAVRRQRAEGTAYVLTPTGRRMPADDGKGYTLINYLIQCHAAEILKKKMLDLDAVLDDGMMILPVHDELVFDVPSEGSEDVQRLIESTMRDDTTYRVPITASSDLLTQSWGQKYEQKG